MLAQSHRKNADDKQVNRIWLISINMSTAPALPLPQSSFRRFSGNGDSEQTSYDAMGEEEDIDAELPPPDVQSFLLHLYFAYVHPFFPIIHKQDFLQSYSAMCVHPSCNPALLMPTVSVIKRPQCATCAPGAEVHEPPLDAATLQDVVALHVCDCCKILGSG